MAVGTTTRGWPFRCAERVAGGPFSRELLATLREAAAADGLCPGCEHRRDGDA